MKLRHPRLIRAAARLGSLAVRAWMGTLRFRYYALQPGIDPRRVGIPGRYAFTFWHEYILLPLSLYGRRDIHVLISQHADGELIASIAEHLGFSTVRGSSTRGGIEAVRQLLRLGPNRDVAVTPDGPRGPRRQVQPGLVYLAARTGLPVVPLGIGFDRPWRAGSWDRFALPRPFARGVVVTGVPVYVPRGAERIDTEFHRRRIEDAINHATALAERWAAAGRSDGMAATRPARRCA